jgi:pimeloyl-ACP methyl ester carboxylesterase
MPFSCKTLQHGAGSIRRMSIPKPLQAQPASGTATSGVNASSTLAFGHSRFARSAASALRLLDRLVPDLAARLAVNLFFTPLPTKLASRRPVPAGWRAAALRTPQEAFTLLQTHPAAGPAQRPRVLLVHGWAGDALQMLPLGQALLAAGFEPVLMDLPARGRSAGWRCTMPQIERSLVAAQAKAGPFVAIVAHSMGAVASLHAMACGLPVARLVALAPSSTPQSVLRWFGEGFGLSPALLARMRARIEQHERMALASFEPLWLGAHVAAPVLLVHDRGDRMAPFANSEALAHELPAAQLHATEGLSHRRVLQDPRAIELIVAHLLQGQPAPVAVSAGVTA